MGHRRVKRASVLPSESLSTASPEDVALFAAELGQNTFTLDLHGKDTFDALNDLDAFIQEAFMREEPAIRVIHGNGSGALRDAVRGFLTKHVLVQKWRPAPMPHATATVHAVIVPKR